MAAATLLLLAALEAGSRLLGLGAPERISLPPKPTGSFRILAFGESTVLGVPEGAYGFTSFLTHELRRLAPGRAVELHNLARSGIGSASVRAAFEQTIDSEVDLAIVLMGHNEFLVAERTRGWRGALWRLRQRSQLASALARAVGRDDTGALEPPLPERILPVWPESEYQHAVLEAFRKNLEAIVAKARERGVPLILATAPSNLADWPPAFERVERPDAASHAEAVRNLRTLLAENRPADALVESRIALEQQGEDALLLYLEARALRALGRPDEASPRVRRARDLDLVPRRATDAQNDMVRAAARQPGVHLVDAVQRFETAAQQGLVGFDLLCDNCHPTPQGHALIGHAIATVMSGSGLLLAPGAQLGSVGEWLARLDHRLGDETERRRVHARWLLSNAIYAMKTPFFNFEASRRYLDLVRRIAPGDWRVWANLATLSLLDGDVKKARRQLLLATRLHGAPLDPEDRGSAPYLAEALSRSGVALPRPVADGS